MKSIASTITCIGKPHKWIWLFILKPDYTIMIQLCLSVWQNVSI